jgi:autotransporter-associated beta strand protein
VAGEAAPVVLVFPDTATGYISSPNVSGLIVDRIEITAAAAPNTYTFASSSTAVTLRDSAGDSLVLKGSGGNVTWLSPLQLQGAARCTVEQATGRLHLHGLINGPGSLTKAGLGKVEIGGSAGANTFAGGLLVREGAVELEKTAGSACFGGNLDIDGGDVLIQNTQQIPDTALINISNGRLELELIADVSPNAETISHLTLGTNGRLKVRLGNTLTLTGVVNCTAAAGTTAYLEAAGPTGKISLGGVTRTVAVVNAGAQLVIGGDIIDGGAASGIQKTGPGILSMISQTSLTGNSFITAGVTELLHPSALGTAAGTVQVAAAGTLELNGAFPSAKTIQLAGTLASRNTGADAEVPGLIVLSGSPTLRGAARPLILSGLLSGTAAPLAVSGGTVRMAGGGSNTFSGEAALYADTLLELGKTSPASAIPGTLRTQGEGTIRLLKPNQFAAGAGRLDMAGGGTFDLNNLQCQLGALNGSGPVGPVILLGTSQLTITGAASSIFGSNTYSNGGALISGTSSSARITKQGNASMTLASKAPPGPAFPTLSIIAGEVTLLGEWPGPVYSTGGVVSGNARTGFLRLDMGSINLSKLNVASMNNNEPCHFICNIYGHNSALYGTMTCRGLVDISSCSLAVTASMPGIAGGQYTLIRNQSGQPVFGTFNNLPEGAIINANGRLFAITYKGGASGQDVVLLPRGSNLSPPVTITGITPMAGGSIKIEFNGPIGPRYSLAFPLTTPPVE